MKQTLSLLMLLAYSLVTAQDPLRDKLNHVFANINKSQIPTGCLQEYATPLLPLDIFHGVLTDSNCVDLDGWRMVYTTLYSSRIYGTNPSSAFTSCNSDL